MQQSNTAQTESIFIDRIKAYGFPILLAVVAFFMMRLITGVDNIQKDLNDIKIKQAEQNGLMQGNIMGIEKRLEAIEKKINKWD